MGLGVSYWKAWERVLFASREEQGKDGGGVELR
jgi:hypothetical protein